MIQNNENAMFDFTLAMKKEIERHEPRKGIAWQSMKIEDLKLLARNLIWMNVNKGFEDKDEIVDLANVLMFLWNRI